MKHLTLLVLLAVAITLTTGGTAFGTDSITVTPGSMLQINTSGLPGTHIREFSTIWDKNDPNKGAIFFVDSIADPAMVIRKATTTDGGLTWTVGAATGLFTPGGAADLGQQRNPVVRDFFQDGNLTGFFGTKQGVYGGGNDANNVLFRAASIDNGSSWSGESLVTFGASPQTLGHTGMNGFIEVFLTSSGNPPCANNG